MAKDIKELFKDINFDLRLAECITCLIGIIVLYNTANVYRIWSLHGWFLVALAYVIAYCFEDPSVWLEIVLLVAYFVVMLVTVFMNFSSHCMFPLISAVLIGVDVVFLVLNKRNK
ncbi:uncharacterized protein LOC103317835 [Nasonia vitripennis]|uniref:Uncharacterized protein n=2 Tax=Pteromalinae TaxID=272242 RepID=A0A7M7HBP6_NASVI|nr:uncharacterized protein LOC103317835 [Nasonia vitripennis]OXU25706.1 hypothetical protein TSAR_014135 [Trichomalopsis sarcophagae]